MKRMSKLLVLVIIVSLLTCLANFATPVSADNGQGKNNKPDQTIVQTDPGTPKSDVGQTHQAESNTVYGQGKSNNPDQPIVQSDPGTPQSDVGQAHQAANDNMHGQGNAQPAADYQPQPKEQPIAGKDKDTDAQTTLPSDNDSTKKKDITTQAQTDDDKGNNELPDRLLVKFEPGTFWMDMARVHQEVGGTIEGVIPHIDVYVINTPHGQGAAKVTAYRQHKEVNYVELDAVAQAVDNPNDPYFGNQWNMAKVHAPEAWDVTKGSSDVRIAILDTGIDLDHPDLASKIVSSINFTDSATTDDIYGHGTHVAGIAAAVSNNALGVAGLGRDCSIMNVKVLGNSGFGYFSWVAQGVTWAADNGANVINLSLGSSTPSSVLESAIDYAWSKGVVVVAAAGNNSSSSPLYPAYYANCIAVASTNSDDTLSSFSNYGNWVDVAAPGASIYSCTFDGLYGYKSGTSMASPHVAGLSGLVFTVTTDLNGDGRTNDEVRGRIESNCDNIGDKVAYGRINALKAVLGVNEPDPSPTPTPAPAAAIDIEKYVSVDGGMIWADADAAPGPTATFPGTVQYKIMVTNTGNAPLTGVAITDSDFTFTGVVNALAVGGSDTSDILSIASVVGQHENSAAVEAYDNATKVTDSDMAHYYVDPALAPKPMWVDQVNFSQTGRGLRLNINVVDGIGPVSGATMTVSVTLSGGCTWYFNGTTDTAGLASFLVQKAPAGSYEARIWDLTASGHEWDSSRGLYLASYTASSNSGKPPKGR